MVFSRAGFIAAGAVTALSALALFGHSGSQRAAGPAIAAAADQYLAADHLVLKSARDVDVKAGTVVVPIHRGVVHGKTVWYIITDASDYGIAHDLNVLYAPKLANMAINCAECVQTATLGKPTGKFNNDAILHFEGAPNFAPTRVYDPSATGFPRSKRPPAPSAMRTIAHTCGSRDRT
jgi:hypothetical protein